MYGCRCAAAASFSPLCVACVVSFYGVFLFPCCAACFFPCCALCGGRAVRRVWTVLPLPFRVAWWSGRVACAASSPFFFFLRFNVARRVCNAETVCGVLMCVGGVLILRGLRAVTTFGDFHRRWPHRWCDHRTVVPSYGGHFFFFW